MSIKKSRAYKRVEKKEKIKMQLIEMLGNCCALCKQSNLPPCVYDFHHVNPEEKKFNVARKIQSEANFDILKQEAKKCVLLCSNCHRIAHIVKERLFK